ncbi:MAG: tetratricopeptide repeat protein, partial [Paucimonas sp.]|nr:tetratricopeptide repeat protein [Paucimonas sp.]
MKSFTLDGLQKKYGIRRGVITELMRGGFIEPARGKRREYRFSFHDLVLMRMAQDLHGAGISARKLTRFLKDL